jgi:hypothetical protein
MQTFFLRSNTRPVWSDNRVTVDPGYKLSTPDTRNFQFPGLKTSRSLILYVITRRLSTLTLNQLQRRCRIQISVDTIYKDVKLLQGHILYRKSTQWPVYRSTMYMILAGMIPSSTASLITTPPNTAISMVLQQSVYTPMKTTTFLH